MDNVNRPIRKDSIKRVFLSMDDLNGILGAVKYSYMPKEWHSRDYAILYLFYGYRHEKNCIKRN